MKEKKYWKINQESYKKKKSGWEGGLLFFEEEEKKTKFHRHSNAAQRK